jgi:DNA-binding NarL/FixJ family response regulator
METIRVAIVDNHQSVLDGCQLRLSQNSSIHIVAMVMVGIEIEPVLSQCGIDVLLLDLSVPTSHVDQSPYPVLQTIPALMKRYANLRIVILSMYSGRSLLVRAVRSGVSGYIVKDDHRSIQQLGAVIEMVAQGETYFSPSLLPLVRTVNNEEPLLTPRQAEVLALCAAYPNETTAQLAERMHVAHSTVRNLLSGVYTKLGINNRTAAVARAQELGLIL